MFSNCIFIKIISKDFHLCLPFYELSLNSLIRIEFHESLQNEIIREDFLLKKSPLIFYDLEDNEMDSRGLDSISELTDCIKSIESFEPIIIITNITSKSDSLKKLLGYKNIICINKKISIDLVKFFTNNFNKKVPSLDLENYYHKPAAPQRVIDVFHTIMVTSLSGEI